MIDKNLESDSKKFLKVLKNEFYWETRLRFGSQVVRDLILKIEEKERIIEILKKDIKSKNEQNKRRMA